MGGCGPQAENERIAGVEVFQGFDAYDAADAQDVEVDIRFKLFLVFARIAFLVSWVVPRGRAEPLD